MIKDQMENAARLARAYCERPSFQNGPVHDLARAYLHLYAIHQSSPIPTGEEAQPGSPSPSAPAVAEFWPCVPVECLCDPLRLDEGFDANDDNKPKGFI